MSPENQFPTEIYETIIDFLAAENNSVRSLKACSLVSHDFLPLARNHLFHTIKLNANPSYGPNLNAFVQLLLSTPDIGKHVHTLYYYVLSKDRRTKKLAQALNLLTQLRTLYISQGHHDYTIPLSLNDFSSSLKGAILSLFRLPTLRRLRLGPINNFNISDLSYCTGLKYLNIYNVRFAPTDSTVQEYYSAYHGSDDMFHLSGTDGVLLMDFKGYSYMEVKLDKALQSKIKTLFAQCSQLMDIRTYKIDYGYWPESTLIEELANMILPSLATLQHLHIHTRTPECDNLLAILLAEFKAIADHNVIESISINMRVLLDDDDELVLGNNWSALDWALTQRDSGWASLKKVSLKMHLVHETRYSAREEESEEVLRRLPESQLKGLVRSDDIKFEFEFTSSCREDWN